MYDISQGAVQNRLLKALLPGDFALLQPSLELMPTELRQVMIEPNGPVRQLFFPESGFTSVVARGGGNQVEVGLIGREGLVGATPVLLGTDRTPYEHFTQGPGEVLRIGIDDFQAAVDQSPSLRKLLLRFVQSLLIQTAQTAFVNATYTIEARLARWLLMCQDRIGGNELQLTHEFMSMMLGVQRTSVTLALQVLEGASLIRARRGRIEVCNRELLLATADDAYGLPEAEYTRLIEGS
jgi:CRP-like cAMP-binding protein